MQYPKESGDEPITFTEADHNEIVKTLAAAFQDLYKSLYR